MARGGGFLARAALTACVQVAALVVSGGGGRAADARRASVARAGRGVVGDGCLVGWAGKGEGRWAGDGDWGRGSPGEGFILFPIFLSFFTP